MCISSCVPRELIFSVSQVCAPLGMLRETQIFQYMYVYAPPRVAAEIKFFHFPSTYVQMCPSSCAPRQPNSSISQVCNPSHLPPRRPNCSISQVCAFLVCQNSHLLKYVPILVCPARVTFLHFASMCPSSCAPREQQISIARACAHPRVPRGYQTSPLLKYVSLTMCPAEIQILHLSSMCLSLHVLRGDQISAFIKHVSLLVCPAEADSGYEPQLIASFLYIQKKTVSRA